MYYIDRKYYIEYNIFNLQYNCIQYIYIIFDQLFVYIQSHL